MDIATWALHATDSPLYVHLAEVIADDPDLTQVLDGVVNTPAPNVLFAAVQMILARHPDDPLAAYYPNRRRDPLPLEDVGPHFRRFVLEHEPEVSTIGATRYTQTNESRRTTALLPGIWSGPHDRFHLVDVGASAGLNLALDRYRYRWGDVEWGDSPLLLEAESLGADPRPRAIEIGRRIGLDVNPLDPSDPDDRAWLEALVWPEAADRLRRLRTALEIAAGTDMEMVAGDATESLPGVLASLPADDPVVVMDSFTLNQFSPEQRQSLEGAVAVARGERPVLRVSFGLTSDRTDAAALSVDDGDGWREVGVAHHHGRWLDLYVLP